VRDVVTFAGQEDMDNLREYPKRIHRILKKWHSDAVTAQDCEACSSPCCSHGGFAILENVLAIYDLYQRGELKREDYEFPPGMSFLDFIKTHFDVSWYPTGRWFRKKEIVCFFMKSLSSDGHLITIPWVGNSFHETRATLFEENPWLNKGCVFLSKKVDEWPSDDKDASRRCILHHPVSSNYVTHKPIDCVFYVCVKPHEPKVPTRRLSSRWLRALAISFPNSVKRFGRMVEEEEKGEENKEENQNPTSESN